MNKTAKDWANRLVDNVSTATQLDVQKGELCNVEEWRLNTEKLFEMILQSAQGAETETSESQAEGFVRVVVSKSKDGWGAMIVGASAEYATRGWDTKQGAIEALRQLTEMKNRSPLWLEVYKGSLAAHLKSGYVSWLAHNEAVKAADLIVANTSDDKPARKTHVEEAADAMVRDGKTDQEIGAIMLGFGIGLLLDCGGTVDQIVEIVRGAAEQMLKARSG